MLVQSKNIYQRIECKSSMLDMETQLEIWEHSLVSELTIFFRVKKENLHVSRLYFPKELSLLSIYLAFQNLVVLIDTCATFDCSFSNAIYECFSHDFTSSRSILYIVSSI